MKNLSLRVIIALFTFTIGFSFVTFWCLQKKDVETIGSKAIFEFSVDVKENEKPSKKGTFWETFLTFQNQNLTELNRDQEIILLNALDGLIKKPTEFGLQLRLVSKISDSKGQINYVLIGEDPLLTIPGNCTLHFQIFDSKGKHLNSISFNAGYRIALEDLKVRYSTEIGREIIEVRSKPFINGRDIVKQYYALIDKKIVLIRLENSKGQITPNMFSRPSHTIGLNLSRYSDKQLRKSFKSKDTAEILASLSWLNGIHLKREEYLIVFNSGPSNDEIDQAYLIQKFRNDKNINIILKELSHSGNHWVKEAANLAKADESR